MNEACVLGDKDGCWHLSTWYMGPNPNSKPDKESTMPPSSPPSKDTKAFFPPRDMKKAFEYALKACNMSHPQCCANVSRMYRLGEGVEQDLEKAKEYKQKTLDITESIDKDFPLNFSS